MPRAKGNGETARAEKQGATPDIANRRKRTCEAPTRRKRGGQFGNKNAVGHCSSVPKGNTNAVGNNGGAPEGNRNAEKHGLFSKYFTEDCRDIYEDLIDADSLTLLWHNIIFLQAEILRSQRLMYVKDHEDHSTTQIGFTEGKTSGETWQIQYAWDKQGSYIKSLSRSEDALRGLIKEYLELEGMSKADTKDQIKDWKAAIIEIAKRRGEADE